MHGDHEIERFWEHRMLGTEPWEHRPWNQKNPRNIQFLGTFKQPENIVPGKTLDPGNIKSGEYRTLEIQNNVYIEPWQDFWKIIRPWEVNVLETLETVGPENIRLWELKVQRISWKYIVV